MKDKIIHNSIINWSIVGIVALTVISCGSTNVDATALQSAKPSLNQEDDSLKTAIPSPLSREELEIRTAEIERTSQVLGKIERDWYEAVINGETSKARQIVYDGLDLLSSDRVVEVPATLERLIGEAWLREGRPDEALAHFESSSQNMLDSVARIDLALTYALLGNKVAAAENFTENDLYRGAGFLQDELVEHIRQEGATRFLVANIAFARGLEDRSQGHWELADFYLKMAHDNSPDNPVYRFYYGYNMGGEQGARILRPLVTSQHEDIKRIAKQKDRWLKILDSRR